jgi:hypothetical protein
MNYFSIRTSGQDLIGYLLAHSDKVVIDGLTWHKDDISKGDIVFVVISGDSSRKAHDYKNGLYCIGTVSKLPFAFSDKKFSIEISSLSYLDRVFTKDDFYIYPDLKNAPNIGPETKQAPNQAIRKMDELTAKQLMNILANDFSQNAVGRDYSNINYSEISYVKLNASEDTFGGKPKSAYNYVIDAFVKWFHGPENFKPSYAGHVNYNILKSWDDIFFNGKLFQLDSVDNVAVVTNKKHLLEIAAQNTAWNLFNESTSRGAPNAILGNNNYLKFLSEQNLNHLAIEQASKPDNLIRIYKPFILFPGISGTGKSRFVRWQVKASDYLIVPVRPDWHEPSDLLGYVSRISGKPEYVATDTLRFMADAWKNAYFSASTEDVVLKPVSEMQTYWLCLDEMNLAPVEQYFADYLSVLESRKWDGSPDSYSCDPILRIPDGIQNIRIVLGLASAEFDGLWNYFSTHGMPLPPNLIVAGTVNMDETTHGFSRKVIDRALTFDFGEFFPNDFGDYFEQSASPVKLGFPTRTHIDAKSQLAGVAADNDGEKSIIFLSQVNDVLKGTSFELAYRALNELLLSVCFHSPADDAELTAVWDDFIMMKVLPRIEGDNEKLASRTDEKSNVIQQLEQLLLPLLPEAGKRTDFYRAGKDGVHPPIAFRSINKLRWMQKRLDNNGFTSFWP